jgi:hypothetical protein
MFRRRTDQVYATLQQVQRRISEQSGQPSAPAPAQRPTAPAIRTPLPAIQLPGNAPARPAARITTPLPGDLHPPAPQVAPAPQSAFQPNPPPYLSGSHPAGVHLSVQSMITLALVVVVLCGLCLYLGWRAGSGGRADQPAVDNRPTYVDQGPKVEEQQKLYVIVVHYEQSAARAEALRATARKYDDWIVSQPGGWPRGFGVRQTSDGGIQLFYGLRSDGTIGIPQSQGNKDLATILRKQPQLKVTWEAVAPGR